MKEKKNRKGIIVFTLLSVILLIGVTYAFLSLEILGEKTNVVKIGDLNLVLDESMTSGITIENGVAITDEEGLSQEGSSFSLVNNGTISLGYTIYLDDDTLETGETRIDDKYIKFSLDKKDVIGSPKTLPSIGENPNRILDQGVIAESETIPYKLRMWFNSEVDGNYSNQTFKGKLRVEVTQDASGVNAPKLASNMIPVKYDGSAWVKAGFDTSWYDYNDQKWANAVTVSEESRNGYLNAKINTPISMDDINTMWVWIPRYSYTIGSEDGTNYYGKQGEYLDTAPTKALPGEIDVKFIPTSTKETGSAKYKVSEGVSGWRTPDGFTFGEKELSGVWVAKFETSNKEGSYTSDDSNLTPIVKPSVTSWRSLRVSTMETVAMNMTKENNIYGLISSEVDSHMMKNSEWSLAAYLSQSKYGKLGNRSYTGANKEIYINNYSGHKTGCSAGAPSSLESSTCPFEYDNLTDRGSGTGSGGGGASTTGNIYGIYDMSGGAWEYVMGNYNNYSGRTSRSYTVEEAKALLGKDITSSIGLSNSGYSGPTGYDNQVFEGLPFPESKYYNLYATNNTNTACNGKVCTSHALSEVAGWYGEYAQMVTPDFPWLFRGGAYGSGNLAGVFRFYNNSGNASYNWSFRLVLTP